MICEKGNEMMELQMVCENCGNRKCCWQAYTVDEIHAAGNAGEINHLDVDYLIKMLKERKEQGK